MDKVNEAGGSGIIDEELPEVTDPTQPGSNPVVPSRRPLTFGAQRFIWPRSLNRNIKDFASKMALSLGRIRGVGGVFSGDFKPQSLEQIDSLLREQLGEGGWDTFVRPILANPLDAAPSPVSEEARLRHRDAERAATYSDGTLGGFIRQVIPATNAKGVSELDYAKRLLTHLNDRLSAVLSATRAKKSGSDLNSVYQGTHTPGLGMFARSASTFPPEWVSMLGFGTSDNRSTSHSIAERAAFGKDFSLLGAAIEDMALEAGARKTDILNMLPEGERSEGNLSKLPASLRAEYERLSEVSSHSKKIFQTAGATLNPDNGITGIDTLQAEMLSSLYSLMTFGARSGLKNVVSFTNAFNVAKSFGPESIADFAKMNALVVKYGLNSITSAFGVDFLSEDEALKRVRQAGLYDPINYTRPLDPILAPNRGLGGKASKATVVMRAMRELATATRVGANFGSSTPALRTNPFSFTQSLVNVASAVRLSEGFHDLVLRAGKFYLRGGSRTKLLTPEDLGINPYNKQRALAFIELMSNEGVSLEEAGLEAAAALKSGKPYRSQDVTRAANMVAVRDIAGEAMPTSRAMALQGTRFRKSVLGTFTGWSIKQATQVASTLANSSNRIEMRSALRGAVLFMAATLPAALAYSWLLDMWDDLVDRPRNKRPVTNAEGELSLVGVVDALTEVGSLGIAADPLATVVGAGGGKNLNSLLSIDSRVPLFSAVGNLVKSFRDLNGALDGNYISNWDTLVAEDHVRRFGNAVGANGMLQNLYLLDKIADGELGELPVAGVVFRTEREHTARTGLGNLIRMAAIAEGVEGASRGFDATNLVRNPVSDHVSKMARKAIMRDEQGFVAAYEGALKAARRFRPLEDPEDYVKNAYAARTPLKVGSQMLRRVEFERIIAKHLDPDVAGYVKSAVDDYNSFGQKYLGMRPNYGTEEDRLSKVQKARREAARLGLTPSEYLRRLARENEDAE
jgi:hypothetical protein